MMIFQDGSDKLEASNMSHRERSAFKLLLEHLRALGVDASFLGSPENEIHRYPDGLTIDGHLLIDDREWYIDHTILPLPQSKILPSVMSEACAVLQPELKKIAKLSTCRGLLTTVVPQSGRKELRNRYYRRVLAIAYYAAVSNRPISSKELWGDDESGWTATEPRTWDSGRVEIIFSNQIQYSYYASQAGWSAETGDLQDSVGEAIRSKLSGQLTRARRLSADVALILDARRSPSPKKPVLWIAEPLVVRSLMAELIHEYPGVLSRAWLIRDNEPVIAVY